MNLKTFCINKHIVYKEKKVSSDSINKFYEIYNPNGEQIVAIPDGCIDIEFVWQNGRMSSLLCGSLVQGTVSKIGIYDYCFGIKFNSGMLPNSMQVNANEVINGRYDLNDFVNIDRIESTIFRNCLFEEKINYFLNFFDSQKRKSENEIIVSYVIEEINKNCGYIHVNNIIQNIGYSHCYTNRVFKNVVGFSIKKYANIIRLQESIDILKNKNQEEIYDKLGYYDQAHFIKDFKKFTLITPKVYTKRDNEVRIV